MDPASLSHLTAALQAEPTPDGEEGVWPENVATVQAFLAVSTQWRVVSIGGAGFAPALPMFIGLDYASVRVSLDAIGMTVTPALWRGLQIMETAAGQALNEDS
uniref:DUF1799 domain-containing protein n=2 Tax=Bradyrhizobium quebecense TaxID=2748629 RepID=A0A974ABJ9_9BRAD